MNMAKYKVLSRVEVGTFTTATPDRIVYEPGSTIECDELQAAQLLEAGAIGEDKPEEKDKPKLQYHAELAPSAIPPRPSTLPGMPKPEPGTPTAEETAKPTPPGPGPAVGAEVKPRVPGQAAAPASHPPPAPHARPEGGRK
jgi:hypothetical protein